MADQSGSLTGTCSETYYSAVADPMDERPIVFCKNGHTLCSTCTNTPDFCPACCESKEVVTNLVEERQLQNLTLNDAGVPEISADHVKLAAQPFANGSFADVYDAEWQNQSAALKVLRRRVVSARVLQDVLEEACLAMSLNHPNVVRVFGVVSIDGGKGILMEKADRGSLRSALDTGKLLPDQQVSISIDIVDGLDYIHSKRTVHRDLKPENVLLFDIKSRLTAKIADFGTSKVIQSSLAGTAMVGTPYYMAPELFQAQVQYGSKVDVYSVATVLYEVFSGQNISDAYPCFANAMQFCRAVEGGQRPEIPESFPAELRTLIERGWSADADVRPMLSAYREALCRLMASTRDADPTANTSTSTSTSTDVSAVFEAQLQKLEQSAREYKLKDARSRVEACKCLLIDYRDRTTASASTARYHSVKGYVHHWFGEYSEAYAETYQALTELYKLCLLGVSVEGEQVVSILRYAVTVCWSRAQLTAAIVLLTYAVRFAAKSKLSAAAYADALGCFNHINCGSKTRKIQEFVLSTRQKASAYKPDIKVAAAHYYVAQESIEVRNHSVALHHLEEALRVINEVDADNIWAAVCNSWKANIIIIWLREVDQKKVEEAQRLQENAVAIAERMLPKCNETVFAVYFNLAFTFDYRKRLGVAEEMHKKVIKVAENSLGSNNMLFSRTLRWLADTYVIYTNRYQEAEELYLRSIEIVKSVYGPGHSWLPNLYQSLAKAYTKWGKTAKARTYSQLKLEAESGKLEDKFKSSVEPLYKLLDEVLRALDGDNEAIKAPGELVDVLSKFFEVAPKPQLI